FFEGNMLKVAGGSFALSLAGIFVVGFVPQVLSFLFVTGLERMVAARIEATATRAVPQMGKAVLAGGARGLATGATMTGRAAYAQAIKVKPIADVMRSAGVMIGRAREAISRTLDRVQSRLEDRMARARRILTRDQAGLETWRGLERDFERFTVLDGAYREAGSRFAEALEYYHENPGDALAGAALFLAREEYERLKAEREAERELLEEKVRRLRELNAITGDDYRALMTGVREAGAVPAIALQYAKKRVKDYEEQLDVDRAQLLKEEAIDKPMIGIVERVRGAPKKAWQELRRRVSEWFEIRGPRGQE
ncbi:MAG: hypothetical protein LM563_05750, partial [Thermofilum sp.]|nr:hypothetical protein [Thermofilum sp.]